MGPRLIPPMIEGRKGLLSISRGCDTDCVFCLRNETRKTQPRGDVVDFGALDAFLDVLRRLGIETVELGGDEPTMLDEASLERVVKACRERGFRRIALSTNGVKLGEQGLAPRLAGWGVNVFLLPLYGPDAAVHDAVTQRPGSFEALSRTIRTLAGLAGVRALCHTVLLRQNEKRLPQMKALAAGWGLGLQVRPLGQRAPHVDYQALMPRRRAPGGGRQATIFHYDVLGAQVPWPKMEKEGVAKALARHLRGCGLSASAVRGALAHCDAKPTFRNPRLLAALLEMAASGRMDELEMRLAQCRKPEQTLALALDYRGEQAFRCLARTLEFQEADPAGNRAKELAKRLLEASNRTANDRQNSG